MKKSIQKMYKNRIFRQISMVIFLVALLLIGAYTLAFLTAEDETTNKFHTEDTEIELLEPAWHTTGSQKAEKLVPGMIVDKDPYVMNVSENDVYVRMGIEITYDGKALKKTDAAYKKFIAIMCIDPSDDVGDTENLISSISGLMNNNQTASKNEHFVYKNGWFYYVDSEATDKPYKILHTGDTTERLFYELHFPVLKKDYVGSFDKPFTIKIVAQGVPVNAVSDINKLEESFDKYVNR